MKTRIFNLIILDESGSMECIKKEAINSVNETIQTIRAAEKKHEEQEHFVSLVTFNDEVKTIHECVSVGEVTEFTTYTYQPDCCTALYDAMGMSLNALSRKVSEQDRVLVTVVTDGCENASREYSGESIKVLVEKLKSKGWVFAYIGANHDVEKVAASISIHNSLHFHSTSDGVSSMSQHLSRSRTRLYDKFSDDLFCPVQENENFFDEV